MQENVKIAENEIVIYPRKDKLRTRRIIIVAGCIGAVASFYTSHPSMSQSIGMAIIFGLIFIPIGFEIYRTFHPKPLCVINREGLLDRITVFGVGWIKWNEIKELKIFQSVKINFIGVTLNEHQAFSTKLNLFKKLYLKLNVKLGYPPVSFYPAPLGLTVDELLKLIEEFRKP